MTALGMNDVGTRMQHLMELQDIWSTGLEYMQRGHYLTVGEKSRIAELENALKLLGHHMRSEYSDITYAREINSTCKAENVSGGRGTPLKSQEGEPGGID